MNYARAALVERLKLVSPALAKSPFLLLSNLFFTGDTVVAYNDRIGMRAPLDGCPLLSTPGAALIKLLESSTGTEVSLDLVNHNDGSGGLNVKAAGMRASLAATPDPPPFTWPTAPEAGIAPTADWLSALKLALRLTDDHAQKLQATGVTLAPYPDGGSAVYATDGRSILRCIVDDMPPLAASSLVLPAPFCEQLVKLGKPGVGKLAIGDGIVLYEAEDVTMFGKLIGDIDEPFDFEGTLADLWPASFAELPPGFDAALTRAKVIGNGADIIVVRAEVQHGEMTLTTQGSGGELTDKFDTDHPAIKLGFDAALLQRGMGADLDQIGLAPKSIMLASQDVVYVIASHPGT